MITTCWTMSSSSRAVSCSAATPPACSNWLDMEGGADKAEAVYDLEHALAEVHWTKEENRNPVATYNPKTMAELEELAPNVRLGCCA